MFDPYNNYIPGGNYNYKMTTQWIPAHAPHTNNCFLMDSLPRLVTFSAKF